MIDFNNADINMPAIKEAAGLNELVTKYRYRVYGLKDKPRRKAVDIEYSQRVVADSKVITVCNFLKRHKISCEVRARNVKCPTIYIGLKQALRQDVKLSAAIITTLVYGIEGRIEEELDLASLVGIAKRANKVLRARKAKVTPNV